MHRLDTASKIFENCWNRRTRWGRSAMDWIVCGRAGIDGRGHGRVENASAVCRVLRLLL